MHPLAVALQVTDKPGAVVAGALDRPEACTRRVPLGKTDRFQIAAPASGHPLLRDHGAGARVDDRQSVLVAVGVDANRVVQFICKHQTDPPTRRVRFAGLEQSNRAAGL
jgi:hypothetical protein